LQINAKKNKKNEVFFGSAQLTSNIYQKLGVKKDVKPEYEESNQSRVCVWKEKQLYQECV